MSVSFKTHLRSSDGTAIPVNAILFFQANFDKWNNIDIESFLYSYRRFMSPKELLDTWNATYDMAKSDRKQRHALLAVLKLWLEKFDFDFSDELKGALSQVTFSRIKPKYVPELQSVMAKASWNSSPSSGNDDDRKLRKVDSKSSVPATILDQRPLDIAKALTLADWKRLTHVPIAEILKKTGWFAKGYTATNAGVGMAKISQPPQSGATSSTGNESSPSSSPKTRRRSAMSMSLLTPHLSDLANKFNNQSLWVVSAIIEAREESRLNMLLGFILIAWHCRKLYNYQSMMAILSGLQSSALLVFEDLWNRLPDTIQRKFDRMTKLMDPLQNFRSYRRELKKRLESSTPLIPYFPLLLRDLIFVKDGNEIVSMPTMKLVYTFGANLRIIHSRPYLFTVDPTVSLFCQFSQVSADEDELFEAALKLRPHMRAQYSELSVSSHSSANDYSAAAASTSAKETTTPNQPTTSTATTATAPSTASSAPKAQTTTPTAITQFTPPVEELEDDLLQVPTTRLFETLRRIRARTGEPTPVPTSQRGSSIDDQPDQPDDYEDELATSGVYDFDMESARIGELSSRLN